jgi:hypothetical protein
MRRAMGLIAAVGVTTALTAACGDDRPSEQALTDRVTEICLATGERMGATGEDFDWASFDPETSDLAAIAPLIEEHVAIASEASHELDKVRGPKSGEAKIDRWIEVNDAVAENAEVMIVAARTGDREQFMASMGAEEELMEQFPDEPMLVGC